MLGSPLPILTLATSLIVASLEPSASNPPESTNPSSDPPLTLARPFPIDRYQPLLESNPFTLIKPETETAPNFARNLSIIGIMRSGGQTLAVLFDSETRARITVRETPDPDTGIRIESASLSPKAEDVTLQIAQGNE
ncbi:MAG: hypothetical protein SNJ84_00915, partial [Verrucomicrobiia bacterium]